MNKHDLVKAMASSADISQADAERALNALIAAVADCLKGGEDVTLTGFASLSVRERSARRGRNPQTGKSIEIPASRVVKFKPGKTLKDAVNVAVTID